MFFQNNRSFPLLRWSSLRHMDSLGDVILITKTAVQCLFCEDIVLTEIDDFLLGNGILPKDVGGHVLRLRILLLFVAVGHTS